MPDSLASFAEPTSRPNKARRAKDAARELKIPAQTHPLGTDEDLVTLRMQLKVAEDALNATDNDEPSLLEAYYEANDRFLDAPARTLAGMLLKLERLAELSEAGKDPAISTNLIVLNLIRDLRSQVAK